MLLALPVRLLSKLRPKFEMSGIGGRIQGEEANSSVGEEKDVETETETEAEAEVEAAEVDAGLLLLLTLL